MKQEDKQLLLADLCARLPYDVKLQVRFDYGDNSHKEGIYDAEIDAITSYNIEVTYYDTNIGGKARDWTFMYEEVKPYLRPMLSMTEDEKVQLSQYACIGEDLNGEFIDEVQRKDCAAYIDWLNVNHFDYRGLIEKGLALEAPEGMYNIKEK